MFPFEGLQGVATGLTKLMRLLAAVAIVSLLVFQPADGDAARRLLPARRKVRMPELSAKQAILPRHAQDGAPKAHQVSQAELASKKTSNEIVCAVESPHFFGIGRMKKWRGCCTSADHLLSQLVLHFGLAGGATEDGIGDAGATTSQGHRPLLLQFYDKEVAEYIDLEDISWQDFVEQVSAHAILPALKNLWHPPSLFLPLPLFLPLGCPAPH